MYIPYTTIKNYTDELLQYRIKMKNGSHSGEIPAGNLIEFTDVVVGDPVYLNNDEYHATHIINHAQNPKYIISYEKNRIQDMKDNRGYNVIVLMKKPKNEEVKHVKQAITQPIMDGSESFNWKVFIVFAMFLVIMIGALIGIVYYTVGKKNKGGENVLPQPMTSNIEKIMI